jgi:hypothetical protein
MYESKFEPIKLLPVTEEAKKKLKQRPGFTEHSIPFPLSSTPPHQWISPFERKWKEIGGGVNVWFDGGTLNLVCDLENVANVVEVIKQAIAQASHYTQHLIDEEARKAEEGRKRAQEADGERMRVINEALDKIDYS